MYSSSIIIVFLRRSDPQGRIEERARERLASWPAFAPRTHSR